MGNILISFFYFEKKTIAFKRVSKILNDNRALIHSTILDSGAFSYHTHGVKDINVITHTVKTLDIQKVCPFDYLVQLDKIGNPQITEANYQYQKQFGFCRVITNGQDMSTIPDEGKKVFIGGINKTGFRTTDKVIKLAHDCSRYFKDFHLLGVDAQNIIEKIPPCSIDSASTYMGWIFGRMELFRQKKKTIEFYRTKKGLDIVYNFCKDYGLLEVWNDFKQYNHIENRFPLSFLKLHLFSAIMRDLQNLKNHNVLKYHVIHPHSHRSLVAYLWAVRFIKQNKSADLL